MAGSLEDERQKDSTPNSGAGESQAPITDQGAIPDYASFWPHYLRAHRRPYTRALHYAGTALAIGLLAAGLAAGDWRLVAAAPAAGYAMAWIAHFAVEGNRPATFGHPVWSLYSDFRMLALWLGGRLPRELEKAGVGREPPPHRP
jgi:hypothetical protein